jgi:hypothetical protein
VVVATVANGVARQQVGAMGLLVVRVPVAIVRVGQEVQAKGREIAEIFVHVVMALLGLRVKVGLVEIVISAVVHVVSVIVIGIMRVPSVSGWRFRKMSKLSLNLRINLPRL